MRDYFNQRFLFFFTSVEWSYGRCKENRNVEYRNPDYVMRAKDRKRLNYNEQEEQEKLLKL